MYCGVLNLQKCYYEGPSYSVDMTHLATHRGSALYTFTNGDSSHLERQNANNIVHFASQDGICIPSIGGVDLSMLRISISEHILQNIIMCHSKQ